MYIIVLSIVVYRYNLEGCLKLLIKYTYKQTMKNNLIILNLQKIIKLNVICILIIVIIYNLLIISIYLHTCILIIVIIYNLLIISIYILYNIR